MEYTVLIADDEYWTREKLCRMICWEDYSLRLLKPAQNGEEVLERLKNERVDILITDIKMPFVDGVELLGIIRERYPEIVSFVISGYDDFPYVRDSFMAGSVHYLVKPVTKIALVSALVKAMERISKRKKEQSQLLGAASLIEDREFSQLIQPQSSSRMSARPLNTGPDLSLVGILLIKIHNMHVVLDQEEMNLNQFSFQIKKKIKTIVSKESVIVFNNIYRTNEFLVISDLTEAELTGLADQIAQTFSDFQGLYFTFCIGRRSYSMESLPEAYVEVVSLLMTRIFGRRNEVIVFQGEARLKSARKIRNRLKTEQEKQLRHYLESGRYGDLLKLTWQGSGLAFCEEQEWTYMDVRQTLHQILNIFYEFAHEKYDGENLLAVDNMAEAADKAVESLNLDVVCRMVQEMIDCFAPYEEKNDSGSMREIVRQAALYIDTHFSEELTISSLAGKYHVESSYFSRIFREETGRTPVFYITEKRMEKAKEYICGGKIRLTEAAYLVGYDDYSYFSRVFRKNTGLSPREYRNQYENHRR